jgi:hypothetical protein
LVFSLSTRILLILLGKRYAETLCVATSIYLVIELGRRNAFFPLARKKSIIARINDLSENTILLSHSYTSKDKNNQLWLTQHFKALENYLRERERWVIAPKKSTQNELQRDFNKLAQHYISGQNGDHEWLEGTPALLERSKELTSAKNVFRIIIAALPVVLLVLLFYFPSIQDNLGIDATPITIILIAWLLLVIDSNLNLGIVERVSSFAKIIKELK